MAKSPYFTRAEWRSFWITTCIAFAVYVFTLAPNVTLEDSGEFLTASYHLGVPHPPGYPVWAISAYLFEQIPFGNAAWRVNLMSAFYGMLAAGMLCLITCKLAARLWTLDRFREFSLPGISHETISSAAGIVAGLVYAFIDTMWSQAVIAEVYTLNSFFFTALCLLVLRWFDAPGQWRWPCLLSLTFGLGITNHQTLLVSSLAFLFAIFCVDRLLCRDISLLTAVASAIFAWQSNLWFLWVLVAGLLMLYAYLLFENPAAWDMRAWLSASFSLMLGSLATAAFSTGETRFSWLYFGVILAIVFLCMLIYDVISERKALRAAAPFFLSFLMFVGGSSLYLYMPLSSRTNPPMNWGHTQTVEGFRHHITRGQYERINTQRSSPKVFFGQYVQFFTDLRDNFSLPLALIGMLPLVFFSEFPKRERNYLAFTLLCFIFMGFVLVYLLNPKFDEQSTFINRVFYALAHGVYSLWIGLGSVTLLWWARREKEAQAILIFGGVLAVAGAAGWRLGLPWWSHAAWLAGGALYFLLLRRLVHVSRGGVLALGLICALPVIPLAMNWADSEMRGHDFGWRYGHDMLKDLNRDAVVYGGTDPGRFVPTYMIFVESFQPNQWKRDPAFDRRDLYIITQNALADQTYMNYIRDHYDVNRPVMNRWYHKLLGRDKLYPKEPLRLPNEPEFTEIFNQVVQASQGKPDSGVTFQKDASGKVIKASVQGLAGVFAINGAVARWIFEANKAKHSFYVEESYPIPWMYPYLEPAGLIMKLNKEPLKALDPRVVARDMTYWNGLGNELLSNPFFCRDIVARKSFSKLRSSLGGLYAWRGMRHEAEKALQQSLEFYPASGEARSRLIDLYASKNRFADAMRVGEAWLECDPFNPAPRDVMESLIHAQAMAAKEAEYAALYDANKTDPNFIFQYADLLRERGKLAEADQVIDGFLERPPFDPNWWQEAIKRYAEANRGDRVEALLVRWTKHDPKNPLAWFNLASIQSATLKGDEACKSLQKAVNLDTNLVAVLRNEQNERFANIRAMAEFQKLITTNKTNSLPKSAPKPGSRS
ncbi:MAG: DUF2723 domain-containing protein [Verrucomicrobia bacterium]|nr:DUF2723 domain-containing protein [Verrucomicrobiota bacterium]